MRQEKDLMNDLLYSEKEICKILNTAITETSTPAVHQEVKDVLDCSLDMQHKLFKALESKGWYPLEQAEQNKIMESKQQHQQALSQMQQGSPGQMPGMQG